MSKEDESTSRVSRLGMSASQGQPSQPDDASLDQPIQVQESQPALPSATPSQPALPATLPGRGGWESENKESGTQFYWESLVRLRGRARIDAVAYLSLRDGAKCVFCGGGLGLKLNGTLACDIDHINGNTRDNRRWNIRLGHHECNSSSGHPQRLESQPARSSQEGEREPLLRSRLREGGMPSIVASGTAWNSREGEKADEMRALWDTWISSETVGPFQTRDQIAFRDLKYMAHHALGGGSSNTYERYIWEDHYGGPLEVVKVQETGKLIVKYVGKSKLVKKFEDQQKKLNTAP